MQTICIKAIGQMDLEEQKQYLKDLLDTRLPFNKEEFKVFMRLKQQGLF
jgi:hypothetical protein